MNSELLLLLELDVVTVVRHCCRSYKSFSRKKKKKEIEVIWLEICEELYWKEDKEQRKEKRRRRGRWHWEKRLLIANLTGRHHFNTWDAPCKVCPGERYNLHYYLCYTKRSFMKKEISSRKYPSSSFFDKLWIK